jgi:hypothetical protein
MDPATQRTWQVHTSTCEACRVLEATQENDAAGTRRGLKYSIRRTTG